MYAHSVKWVEILGTRYKPPLCVFVCFECDLPVFGKIEDILNVSDSFFLVLHLYKVIVFSSHYHAYKVTATNVKHICSVHSLVDHHPLCMYQPFGSITSYIPLKYYVLNKDC